MADDLQNLLGEDYEVRSGTYYEVFGPDGRRVGHYDSELDRVLGHARVYFEGCDDQTEHFLVELGRRVVQEHSSQLEERGFQITGEDSVTFTDGTGRDCPYYSVGIRCSAETPEEAVEAIKDLHEVPVEFHLDLGLE